MYTKDQFRIDHNEVITKELYAILDELEPRLASDGTFTGQFDVKTNHGIALAIAEFAEHRLVNAGWHCEINVEGSTIAFKVS